MCAFVAFAGSRFLPAGASPLVAACVRSVWAGGRGVAVGCASGADALVIRSCLAEFSPVVFAVGSSSGAGFWRCSAPLALLRSCCPRSVRWLAGGPLSLPLVSRLRARTRACVSFAAASGAGAGLVAFFGSPSSRGTRLACWLAAGLSLPVVAFACGSFALPSLGPGRWVPVRGSGCWASALRWVPA